MKAVQTPLEPTVHTYRLSHRGPKRISEQWSLDLTNSFLNTAADSAAKWRVEVSDSTGALRTSPAVTDNR